MQIKTVGPTDSKIFFLGETPGEIDEQNGLPFQNLHGSGRVFNLLLSQVGINRREVRIRNVALERPPAGSMKHFFYDGRCTVPKPELVKWIEMLRMELEENKPNIVIAMGTYALWALTGQKKISEARGYLIESTLVPGLKVLPTHSPQSINAEMKLFSITVFDIKKALHHAEDDRFPVDKAKYLAPASFESFMDYLETIRREKKRFAFDIEAHIGTAYPYLLGVADSDKFGMSFYNMQNNHSTIAPRQEAQLWHKMGQVGKECECIIHNASYDKAVMWLHHGVLLENVWMDTLVAAHVLWPEYPRSLGFLGSLILDVPAWKHLGKVDGAVYNVLDAIRLYALADPLYEAMKKQNVMHTFDFEMTMLDVAIMLQLRGIKCDNERRLQLLKENKEKAKLLDDELAVQFGKRINFNSPKQMKDLLYYELGLQPQFKRRKSVNQTRIMTTDSKAMKTLARKYREHTWLNKILEYKKLLKLESFLSAEPSPEGRYHTSYNITGSSKEEEGKKSFGRWSSSSSIILNYGSGNLQNIPPAARLMYKCDEGKVMIQADMRQAEAVVVAHLTGDVRMQKFFKDAFTAPPEEQHNYDIHKTTASMMFNLPYDQVTPEIRKIGKTLRHACNYSAGPTVVADRLGIELKEAKELLALYHRANPLLKAWYQTIQNELKVSRTLVNALGRKHRFLDVWGDGLFRSAYSYQPQSTVGDFLNQSMRILYDKYGHEIEILLQLHDAIYVQVEDDPDVIFQTKKKMHECMVRPIKIGFEEFIIEVDFKVGHYWGELLEEETEDFSSTEDIDG